MRFHPRLSQLYVLGTRVAQYNRARWARVCEPFFPFFLSPFWDRSPYVDDFEIPGEKERKKERERGKKGRNKLFKQWRERKRGCSSSKTCGRPQLDFWNFYSVTIFFSTLAFARVILCITVSLVVYIKHTIGAFKISSVISNATSNIFQLFYKLF